MIHIFADNIFFVKRLKDPSSMEGFLILCQQTDMEGIEIKKA